MSNEKIKRLIEKAAENEFLQLDLSGNKISELPPEIQKLTSLTKLNLSFNNLHKLPIEIEKLKNLKQIDLSYNKFSKVPIEITKLKELTNIDLCGNQLNEIPAEIKSLQKLTRLDLSNDFFGKIRDISFDILFQRYRPSPIRIRMRSVISKAAYPQMIFSGNYFTQFPIEITRLENLKQLNLSGNKLTKIPVEISKLKKLVDLDLSFNEINEFPTQILKINQIIKLNLSENQIKEIPVKISKLKKLIILELGGNEFKTLPAEITELEKLRELDLAENQMEKIPIEITKLKSLKKLYVHNNKFKNLPADIIDLENLENLSLSGNQIEEISIEITKLKNLTNLDIARNQIEEIPIEITKLKNLKTLSVDHNKLKILPAEIVKLENLKSLGLSGNQMEEIPIEITKLKNLKKLYVDDNKLKILPAEIVKLENLESFTLSGNQIEEIQIEVTKLKNLTNLNLSNNLIKKIPIEIINLNNLTNLLLAGNEIKRLPPEITELKNLKSFSLSKNPLKFPPPEIAIAGTEAIFAYLNQVDFEDKNEAKLILVGSGDVGKTCLANRLIHEQFLQDKKTEGINISEWKINAPVPTEDEIKLNIWDFGGQEIYHATHQLFLTKRSVYILVWNARKTKDHDHIFYWLHTVKTFGGDSPLILVMTKLNEHDDDLDLRDIKNRFDFTSEYVKVDSEDGVGFSNLKQVISETAWNLPQMQVPWPRSWINVRHKLESLNQNWITNDYYSEICKSESLDETNIEVLDYYLHNLGVILHFKDRIELENMVILNPEWATSAFYQILSTKSISDRGGILLHSDLTEIWNIDEYPKHIYSKLLELMNKFELAYELPDKKSHLVSDLLPKNMDINISDFCDNENDKLCFYYSYDFLPAGIITRFIVRIHENLEKKEDGITPACWRDGALLALDHTHALVSAKGYDKKIEVKIAGKNKRKLLEIISYHLDEINKSFEKISVSKKIPCNCSENCIYHYDYIGLLEAEDKLISEVQCQETWKNVSLSSLLEGYKIRRDKLDDEMLGHDKPNIHVNVSPSITVEQQQSQSTENHNVNTTDISIDLKIDLPMLQTDFEIFKEKIEDLKNLSPRITKELDKIQDNIDELGPESDKDKFNKPLNKIQRFLQKLADPNSEYAKLITGTENGIETAQKLGKTYNKFAQWLALPQVPDLFLGK